jgi:hypothetical protein
MLAQLPLSQLQACCQVSVLPAQQLQLSTQQRSLLAGARASL